MRWRSRDGPWGSHHDDARFVKCVTSKALTEELLPLGPVVLWREEVVE